MDQSKVKMSITQRENNLESKGGGKEEEVETKEGNQGISRGYALRSRSGSVPILHVLALLRTKNGWFDVDAPKI